jgi:hypothetical protein
MYSLGREKVQESIQMNGDTLNAFRTRSCQQQTDTTKIDGYDEEDLGKDIYILALLINSTEAGHLLRGNGALHAMLGQDTNRNKDKELIQRLNAKIKEQQNMIDEQSSAVTEFLKILTTVKKITTTNYKEPRANIKASDKHPMSQVQCHRSG